MFVEKEKIKGKVTRIIFVLILLMSICLAANAQSAGYIGSWRLMAFQGKNASVAAKDLGMSRVLVFGEDGKLQWLDDNNDDSYELEWTMQDGTAVFEENGQVFTCVLDGDTLKTTNPNYYGTMVFERESVVASVKMEERTDASGQWKYVLEGGGVTITGWVEEPSGGIILPGELDGVPVTGIGAKAFYDCMRLTGVTIPDSVTDIGSDAFDKCENLILGVKQGSYAEEYAVKNKIPYTNDLDCAYRDRGIEYFDEGRYEEAFADFTKAIELSPNDAMHYYNRGSAYDSLEKYGEAILDYSKAIELKPDYELAFVSRGLMYFLEEQYEKSVADYTKAIQLNPTEVAYVYVRGAARFCQQKYEEALMDFTRAIELNPGTALYYEYRGDVYKALGNEAAAAADWQKAKELGGGE